MAPSHALQSRRRLGGRRPRAFSRRSIHRAITCFTLAVSLSIGWTVYQFRKEVIEWEQRTGTVKGTVAANEIDAKSNNLKTQQHPQEEEEEQTQQHQQTQQQVPKKGAWRDFLGHRQLGRGHRPGWEFDHKHILPHQDGYPNSHSLCRGFDHSIQRPPHGCAVNTDTQMVFCGFENLRIDPAKLHMVARGGEALSEEVMGRPEEDEFPTYQPGAFWTRTQPNVTVPTEYWSEGNYLHDVWKAMRYPTAKDKDHQGGTHDLDGACGQTYPGTTLFVTRYEYANLYHTLTDWWNTFFVLPRTGNQHEDNNDEDDDDVFAAPERIAKPDRLVFLDGHAKGLLDPVWESLFGDFHYIQHLTSAGASGSSSSSSNSSSGICFERAIFVPPGYKSPLFNDYIKEQCPHRSMAKAFSDFVLKQYGLLSSSSSSSSLFKSSRVIRGSVVVVDRQPFVAHPRSHAESMSRTLDRGQLQRLQTRLMEIPGVTVRLVRLEQLSFREQLQLLWETHVLIGVHGAALSHVLFMDELQSHVIEFQTIDELDFFRYLSEWKGMDYTAIDLEFGSGILTDDGIDETVRRVTNYMT